ncbi:MAG: restriction endonuclease subunit S, partial [Azoarcus sp.]|nr:restriction endonuclease subunit S [Azoarcus sp.]
MSFFTRSSERPAWVANVPDSWGTDWLKWGVRLSMDRLSEEEQEGLPYISNEDIASWTGKLLKNNPQPAESDGRKFQTDDVLLNKLRPYLAKVYHAEFDGVSSGELLCLRSYPNVLSRFLFYVLASKGFIDTINAETFGSKMPRADWEIVGHQPLPLPPLETQRRIARFLDEKTAQIDGLIEKKRALLDRLAEKRQALITRAVTKGLNPDAPMKPSGIDWLGDIPAHWEVLPLKRLLVDAVGLQMGPFGGMLTNLPDYETGYKLYGQENTISGDFSLGCRWIEEERHFELKRYEL